MEEASPLPSAPASAGERPRGLLRRVDRALAGPVLRRLERIRSGGLILRLPDGSARLFGDANARDRIVVTVADWKAFRRVLFDGDTGAGIAYMKGEWRTDELVDTIRLVIANREAISGGTGFGRVAGALVNRLRRNSIRGARRNVARHYDLGNEFFELMLDDTMTYSSAVLDHPGEALETAQARKYRLLADKARIGPGDDVLEIGCGWGGFAEWAAREIGCRVTGITISAAQTLYARERIRRAGLEDRVRIEQVDYRNVEGSFDRIVSIEMLEAVGHANLATWFRTCDRLLAPGGVIAVQVITIPGQRYRQYRRGSDYIRRCIFPGGHLPSLGAMSRALERNTSLGIEQIDNLAPHYAATIRRWRQNLRRNRGGLPDLGFDPEFYRRWDYYLAYCEAAFASRALSTLHLVLSRPGNATLGSEPYGTAAA